MNVSERSGLKGSAWCFVGGWPYLVDTSLIQPWAAALRVEVRRMTDAEIQAMREIGIVSREQICAHVASSLDPKSHDVKDQ